jgi:hypothetical protein
MAYKMSDSEKDAHKMMKDLINKKPKKLSNKDFKTGAIILYSYSAKYDENPYDKNPLCFVLGSTGKYLYGINFNWIPPALRKGIMQMITRANKKNISQGKELEIPKTLVKKIFRMGIPAFRKYLKNRISPKGVIVPGSLYNKVIDLRAEHFINISAEQAWKIAVSKMKKKRS